MKYESSTVTVRGSRVIRVLSLGAGVQSSTLALMIAHGEIPMVDCAIFADTGAEPAGVYAWLDWLESKLPFPVYRVMHKDGLLENIKASIKGRRFARVPFYTESQTSAGGTLQRQCTREFKVSPITQKLRQLCGLAKGQRAGKAVRVTQYLGISWDEIHRMKPSREAWIKHEWPLIDLKMTRTHCLQWMAAKGYPMPTKSACTFCPYHNDALWRDMKLNDGPSWEQAVEVDRMIRSGVRGTNQKLYLHRSMKPLEEVDFRNAEDFGQIDAFGNECEGMCGV
jgi:hypothetical protein